MPDNKDQRGQQDRIRVDSNDPSEVEYLHKQYPGMSHQQIVDAIRKKKRVAYVTRRWWLIAQLLKIMPFGLYRRLG